MEWRELEVKEKPHNDSLVNVSPGTQEYVVSVNVTGESLYFPHCLLLTPQWMDHQWLPGDTYTGAVIIKFKFRENSTKNLNNFKVYFYLKRRIIFAEKTWNQKSREFVPFYYTSDKIMSLSRSVCFLFLSFTSVNSVSVQLSVILYLFICLLFCLC